MRTKTFAILFFLAAVLPVSGQEPKEVIKTFFDLALTDHTAYGHLEYLCKNTEGRIPGSPAAAEAVEYTRQAMLHMGFDSVWLQKTPVPVWRRGEASATVTSTTLGSLKLTIAALGFSVATPEEGVVCEVLEVHSFEELNALGREKVEGKIVFFNRPMDPTMVNTFGAYGGAVDQRTAGASKAAALGAAAALVRSPTHATDDFPHTGVVRYEEGVQKIPALTVSTLDANALSLWLKKDPELKIFLRNSSKNYPDSYSYNVVGELYGSEKPEEFITLGGHLDAWDISQGAHDDAGGCVQSMEVLRLFKAAGIRPKRTLRAVMFMNEEMSGTGGRTYLEEARRKGEKHYMAMESDRGVMTPKGFYFDTQGNRLEELKALHPWFKPYGIDFFERGGSGSDIGPLKGLKESPLLIGFLPDVQRYFDFHHSANDTFEQVNEREMQMGSAAMAALVYLIDLYDL